MAKQKLYDLILMDIQMPIMNGMDATEEIRKLETIKSTKIIAYTAYEHFLHQDNFDWEIRKPSSVKLFSKIIFDVLNKKS